MAPTVHPPCTPSASCAPARCHPMPPPCSDPEKCLLAAFNKGVQPCASAVSILSTTAKLKCRECSGAKGFSTAKSKQKYIEQYLAQKKNEVKLLKMDRLTGSNKYAEYVRNKNKKPRKKKKSKKDDAPCCQGKGSRGWGHPAKTRKKCCVIL